MKTGDPRLKEYNQPLYAWLDITGLVSTGSDLRSGEWLSRFASSAVFATLPQPLTKMCRYEASARLFQHGG